MLPYFGSHVPMFLITNPCSFKHSHAQAQKVPNVPTLVFPMFPRDDYVFRHVHSHIPICTKFHHFLILGLPRVPKCSILLVFMKVTLNNNNLGFISTFTQKMWTPIGDKFVISLWARGRAQDREGPSFVYIFKVSSFCDMDWMGVHGDSKVHGS